MNPEEEGEPAQKRARPTIKEIFGSSSEDDEESDADDYDEDDDTDSSCASDDCSSTQPLDDGAEQEEMKRSGFPFPLDFEVELECIKQTPEHIAELVLKLNDLSVSSKNTWHSLSLDQQFAVLLHLKAFEMPLEFVRFSRFRAFTESVEGKLVRAWPSEKAFDGSREEDRNAFIKCMHDTEDIFDHFDYPPTFVDLRVVCDGISRSFGSAYELTGSDERLVTLSRKQC